MSQSLNLIEDYQRQKLRSTSFQFVLKNIEELPQTDFPFDNEAEIGPITVGNHKEFLDDLTLLKSETD